MAEFCLDDILRLHKVPVSSHEANTLHVNIVEWENKRRFRRLPENTQSPLSGQIRIMDVLIRCNDG